MSEPEEHTLLEGGEEAFDVRTARGSGRWIGAKLKAERIGSLGEELPGWEVTEDGRGLRRSYVFLTTREAVLFAALVAEMGEAVGYAPEIVVRSPEVVVKVSTDPDGGLNELDVDFACYLDHRLQSEIPHPESPE